MNIYKRFLNSVSVFPEKIALEIGKEKYSYSHLNQIALSFSKVFSTFPDNQYIGLLSYRSVTTYASILGSMHAGKCYIPFSPKFPVDRIVKIIEMSSCKILVIDSRFLEIASKILAKLDDKITVVVIDDFSSAFDFFGGKLISIPKLYNTGFSICQAANDLSDVEAYLLFTSGSTGDPKGIPVTHSNLNAYLESTLNKYSVSPEDRISQFFDTTFDPSFHDMFLAWSNGATLVVVPENNLMAPHFFIQENGITIWASVPSIVKFLYRLKVLKENAFPLLKYTLFTGEALYYESYIEWKNAAPNSIIINGYGPTELTMNISDFRIPDELLPEDCYNGIVPIGNIFKNHSFILESKNGYSNTEGELLVSGPQQVKGYFKDDNKTELAFCMVEGERYYKTGDIVEMSKYGLVYKGRKDNQIQVRGFRVELNEIEFSIKSIGVSEAVAIGYPEVDGVAEAVVAFVVSEISKQSIIEHCKKILPDYMVPSKIFFLKEMPLNINGKIDKNQLKIIINENERKKVRN